MTLRVRPLLPGDIGPVLELERATPEAPHWTRDEYARMFKSEGIDMPGALQRAALVAEFDGSLAGFIVLRLVARICELESIVVAAENRRRGVGGALIHAAIGWSREQRASRIELEVRAGNTNAISLYTRCGLRIDGHRGSYYNQPVEDAVLMSLEL